MSLENCPKCRYRLHGEYKYCPDCGKILSPDEREIAEEKELDEAARLWLIGSYNEASKIYYKLAGENNARAQKMVGDEYSSGIDGHYAYQGAFNQYQLAAEQKYTPAIYVIGCCYEFGQGVSRDWQQAVHWYQKAAELGHIHAMYRIGELCEKGGGGLEQDLSQAVQWYQKAAGMGDGYAMYKLGQFYESGTGVEMNLAKAVDWYEKSVKVHGNEGKRRLEEMMQKGCKEAELALKNLNK